MWWSMSSDLLFVVNLFSTIGQLLYTPCDVCSRESGLLDQSLAMFVGWLQRQSDDESASS